MMMVNMNEDLSCWYEREREREREREGWENGGSNEMYFYSLSE